jgi:serine/threonine protein kinase
MAGHPANEEAIFLAALEYKTPEERLAYVDRACAGNLELRNRMLELLQSHESQGPFDAIPPGLQATKTIEPEPSRVGDQIGPYKLLERIGEGGFGVVYMADQQAPVRRRVALKIIKPGMDTWDVLKRFEAERQALALMDHPHIARALDAGATESGRPYFVMELVRGVPITDYCDQNNLAVHERLDLFVQICHAVQHAHQKGIIHRDI